MVKSKSDQLSVQHKDRGNELFREKEHFNALCEYNKALLYAESKENLANAYANRSAVFIDLKKCDEALLNIQWARENDYRADKIQKLIEREEKCKKMKDEQLFDPIDELHDFFKLSYPANPKIPFIADCLYFGETKRHGKYGIFTNRDLKPGDIVAIEKHVFTQVHESFSHLRCCNCLKGKMLNLIPCTKTATLMFCSEKCRDKVYEKVTDFDSVVGMRMKNRNLPEAYGFNPQKVLRETEEAFGGRQNLIEFVKENNLDDPFNNLNFTVFDSDFSNPDDPNYKANLIKCFLSLGVQVNPLDVFYRREAVLPFVKKAIGNDTILEEFLIKLVIISDTRTIKNEYEIPANYNELDREAVEGQVEGTMGAFMVHVNQRCISNSFVLDAEDGYIMCITKPTKAGEEIYINHYSGNSIDKKLKGEKKYMARYIAKLYCECDVCFKNAPEPPAEPIETASLDIALELMMMDMKFDPRHLNSFTAMIDQLKSNWETLDSYYEELSRPKKAPELSVRTCIYLTLLSQLRFMPCVQCKILYNIKNVFGGCLGGEKELQE